MFFDRHLEAACRLEGRPWSKVPNWDAKVRGVWDDAEAASWIESKIGTAPLAFDYETDRLKPDHKESRIVCCSVSDGKTAIAYPWMGKAIEATKRLLRSKTPLIASNVKFEERWSIRHFGVGIKNWLWDTMLAAHVIDNRPKITSIKFQAFVHLGVDSWDRQVKPWLTAKGSNLPNRIKEIDLNQLLRYCAFDSLYEAKVAKKQMKLLGFE